MTVHPISERGERERERNDKAVRHALYELQETLGALGELARLGSENRRLLLAIETLQCDRITALRAVLAPYGDFASRPDDCMPF